MHNRHIHSFASTHTVRLWRAQMTAGWSAHTHTHTRKQTHHTRPSTVWLFVYARIAKYSSSTVGLCVATKLPESNTTHPVLNDLVWLSATASGQFEETHKEYSPTIFGLCSRNSWPGESVALVGKTGATFCWRSGERLGRFGSAAGLQSNHQFDPVEMRCEQHDKRALRVLALLGMDRGACVHLLYIHAMFFFIYVLYYAVFVCWYHKCCVCSLTIDTYFI